MQYADTAFIYACPVCGSRYWEDCIAGCTLYMEREYTDGTVIYNIPRMPWLTQCPRCGSLFDRKFLVFQENFPGRISASVPRLGRGGAEACKPYARRIPLGRGIQKGAVFSAVGRRGGTERIRGEGARFSVAGVSLAERRQGTDLPPRV